MYRFDSVAHLHAWLDSPQRAGWLERAEPHVAGPMRTQVLTGLEGWFTVSTQPGVPPPPAYKMAVVTWVTIFPLITGVVVASAPLLGRLPLVVRLAVTTGVTVPLMTWVVMPRVTRLLHRWLYPIPAGGHDPAHSLKRRSSMLGSSPIDVMLLATDLEVARKFYGEVPRPGSAAGRRAVPQLRLWGRQPPGGHQEHHRDR